MTDYPEHEKLKIVKPQSQAIGDFLTWLQENGLTICEVQEKHPWDAVYHPVRKTIERFLAEYFEIDLVKLELEKRTMLEEFRSQTAKG